MREYIKVKCSECGKETLKTPWALRMFKDFFCSKECFRDSKRNGTVKPCSQCGKDVYRSASVSSKKGRKTTNFFCDRSCATSYNNEKYRSRENHPNWKNGDQSYRDFALKHYGEKCTNVLCPIKFLILKDMLDVHHIDGDRKNNKIENLQVLCVWCHAMITRKINQ